jgi:hypothetical protein
MKDRLKAITGFSVGLALTSAALPAIAYNNWEYGFLHESEISQISQQEGNAFCRGMFNQLNATGDLRGGFNSHQANHIWALIENARCIANSYLVMPGNSITGFPGELEEFCTLAERVVSPC